VKVKMLTSRAGVNAEGRVVEVANVGDEIEIDDAQAELLIERGQAERVGRGGKQSAQAVDRTIGAARETR